MATILDHCGDAESRQWPAGSVLISQGETSGRLFVLVEGQVEVLRGDTQVALIDEPGAIFGEMSVLLGVPHTATVRAVSEAQLYEFADAEEFLRSHPAIGFYLARLLAQRLNAATTYLVDLKRQFEGERNHFGMVGEVLESLMNQQDGAFTEGPERPDDPRL
jgi:CRP/FNR family transcriptional regulator, cyclic AMP receptor protein